VDGKPVRAEFDALKAAGALPMGQVPVLVSRAGAKTTSIAQSKAVARYIAKKVGLLGASDEEAADIDSVCETIVDLANANAAAKTEEEKAAFLAGKLPDTLATLEKLLGAGFSVGGRTSQADIVLYHAAHYLFAPSLFGPGNPPAAALIKASPKIAAIVAGVAALPGVVAWEAGRAARDEPF
jgi:glutathione S-transferase